MISATNLTMHFTERSLLKEVSFSIFPNEKIGLTGPNGAGKTTLFSLLLGQREPVAGSVSMQKNLKIGYLPQESRFDSSRTVMEELTEGDEQIRRLMAEKRKLEDENKADTERYGDVLHDLEQLGIYDLEHKAEKILTGLGFTPSDFHRPIVNLSGGWQMRTLLAKLLTYSYDLLLLDEPTNYLDLSATLWLKGYLANYQGAFILISHDRVFLNDVTNYTMVLENGQLTKVKGNYEEYEAQKELKYKSLEKQQKVVEKKRQQLETFAQRFHAQPNKASAVRNKRKMLERLEEIELPQEFKSIGNFDFSGIQASGYTVVQCESIAKSYGEKQVYKNLDFEIIRGQKICLVGPNGAGKSTLLKMLAGVVKQDTGTIRYGHQVDVGYFSQSRLDVLNPERSVLDEVMISAPQGVPNLKARTLLGIFNFHGDDVFKTVKVLSGGEKSRLILAKLLINPPNFILLDEPTTHLDLDGVKALTTAFKEFQGTVCFISHDLYFIKEIADHIVEVNQGEVKSYPGGLDYYLDKKGQIEVVQREQEKKMKQEQKKFEQEQRLKESSAVSQVHDQHKKALQRINQIKNEIKSLEQELKDLEMESYVKSRKMSSALENRDAEILKEYGQRLKWIQNRQREIETTINQLKEEKDKISK